MGKAKIISVINYKGGVGKTVSAFNIAAGLNFLNHHSVLLIDLDPQCSLSTICLKAYEKTERKIIGLSSIGEEETINSVFKTYLNRDLFDFNINLDLNKIIKKDFYTGKKRSLTPAQLTLGEFFLNCRSPLMYRAAKHELELAVKRREGKRISYPENTDEDELIFELKEILSGENL